MTMADRRPAAYGPQRIICLTEQMTEGVTRIEAMRASRAAIRATAAQLPRRPRLFFDEWDVPHISAIRWVSELVAVAGADGCSTEWRRGAAS